MIPTIDETEEIIKKTKHANIDIKQTISKTITSGFMDSNYYVLAPDATDLPYLFEDEGLEYEFLSDSYFEYINKMMDNDGVYITLAYAPEDIFSDNIIKYGVEDIDDEDELYYYEIDTWKERITLVLAEDLKISDDTSDYGILITKENDKLNITFAHNESYRFGHGMGYNEINSIEDSFNLAERLIIKLMSEAIILKQ